MTLFMASVCNVEEARVALAGGVDIIDIKEPRAGALGAVATEQAVAIVRAAGGGVLTSATVGDIPLIPQSLRAAIVSTARSGASVIKFGLFPGNLAACLDMLSRLSVSYTFVAVIFADAPPPMEIRPLMAALSDAGVKGAVLDTAVKTYSLLEHLTPSRIAAFADGAHAHGLIAGLAGGLQPDDIPVLMPLPPDILGFRGALCTGGRAGEIAAAHVARVRHLIPRNASIERRVHDMLAMTKKQVSGENAVDGCRQ